MLIRLTVLLEYIDFYAQWQNTMSIWVRLHLTAALLTFGVIIYINPTCELNVFYSNLLLLCQHFALCFSFPIMPKFMLAKSTYP